MYSVIKYWCLFLVFLLFMDGKVAADEVSSVSPLHSVVAILPIIFIEQLGLGSVSEVMPPFDESRCPQAVSGQGLPEAVAKADEMGVQCTFYVFGDIILDAPLELKGHRLVGQPASELLHDHLQLLPVRKYERTPVKQRGLDIPEQALILPELAPSFPSCQTTKPLITSSADFSGDALVRMWPGSSMDKLAIDDRGVLGVIQVLPSEHGEMVLTEMDWISGGLSQQKTDGKQCGGGSGGGQGGCQSKPEKPKEGRGAIFGLARRGLNRSGSSSAGAGGEDPSDPSWKKEEPADASESPERRKKMGKKGRQQETEKGNIGSLMLDDEMKKKRVDNIFKTRKPNDTNDDKNSNDIPEAEVDLDNDLQNFNPDLGKSGMNLSDMLIDIDLVSETGSLNIANEEPEDNSGQQASSLNNIGDEGGIAGDPIPEAVNDAVENDDDDIIFPGESNTADEDVSGSVDEDQRALSPPLSPPCGKESGTEERGRSPSPECVDI